MLGLKPGVPAKLKRVSKPEDEPYSEGYFWDGKKICYPNGGPVPQHAIFSSEWGVSPEPKFKVGDRIQVIVPVNWVALKPFCVGEYNDVSQYKGAKVIKIGPWSSAPLIPAVLIDTPNGGLWLPEEALESYKEPTVEEYVKSRGMRIDEYETCIHKHLERNYPCIDQSANCKFTLETAKLACDLLEKLK